MKKDIGMLVECIGDTCEVTIPDLNGLTVRGASRDEALLKALLAIDQARMTEEYAELARKQNKMKKHDRTVA